MQTLHWLIVRCCHRLTIISAPLQTTRTVKLSMKRQFPIPITSATNVQGWGSRLNLHRPISASASPSPWQESLMKENVIRMPIVRIVLMGLIIVMQLRALYCARRWIRGKDANQLRVLFQTLHKPPLSPFVYPDSQPNVFLHEGWFW